MFFDPDADESRRPYAWAPGCEVQRSCLPRMRGDLEKKCHGPGHRLKMLRS